MNISSIMESEERLLQTEESLLGGLGDEDYVVERCGGLEDIPLDAGINDTDFNPELGPNFSLLKTVIQVERVGEDEIAGYPWETPHRRI